MIDVEVEVDEMELDVQEIMMILKLMMILNIYIATLQHLYIHPTQILGTRPALPSKEPNLSQVQPRHGVSKSSLVNHTPFTPSLHANRCCGVGVS